MKMKRLFNTLAAILFILHNDAYCDGTVTVKEGDSVIFSSGVKTYKQNITWHFNDTRIAHICGSLSCTDVSCNNGTDKRFKDRLKLDNQTGSLTITDIKTTDSGVYELHTNSSNNNRKKIIVAVNGVSATERNKLRHGTKGETLTLESNETVSSDRFVTWYYKDINIADIKKNKWKICTNYQCKERFRDRLMKKDETESLTITNINIKDSGVYKLQIIINSSSLCITRLKRFNVTVFFPAVGICVIFVLLLLGATVSAGVIYCRQKKYKPQIKNIKMLISRRRIQKTLLRGFGMALNQTHDGASYKIM